MVAAVLVELERHDRHPGAGKGRSPTPLSSSAPANRSVHHAAPRHHHSPTDLAPQVIHGSQHLFANRHLIKRTAIRTGEGAGRALALIHRQTMPWLARAFYGSGSPFGVLGSGDAVWLRVGGFGRAA